MTNATLQDLQVGQVVTTVSDGRWDISSGYMAVNFTHGEPYEITRVATSKVLLKNDHGSAWLSIHDIELLDGKRARKLGETPTAEDIDIDDPRIAWIWDDAGAIATKEGYCSYCDTIVDKLGAPGRERKFSVKTVVNGLDVVVKVKAKSRKIAEAEVAAKISNATQVEATSND